MGAWGSSMGDEIFKINQKENDRMLLASSVPRKTALLGAYDRFNYGDLLFPIIVRNEMAVHSPATGLAIHALVESDLSRFGALKTLGLRALYQRDALHSGDVVMFAGGGTIGVDWNYMHANLLGRKANLALYYLKRLMGVAVADGLSRRYFGARAPFPWVAGPEDFPVPVKVAYNAVGGSEFARLAPSVQARTLQRLEQAAYLSVRDAETKRLFAPVEGKVSVELAPDSAVLMSEQFPVSWLQHQAAADLLALLDEGPYLCFQANLQYARHNASQIIAALEAIYEQHGLRIVLLPIGRYVGLDDQLALREIQAALRVPSAIVSDEASIWEIMLVIARAKIFLGTSLHGNVTSQSFAVPHLGLRASPGKLDHYLATWDIPEQSSCVSLDTACARVGLALAVPEAARQQKRVELIARSHENFTKMACACELEWR